MIKEIKYRGLSTTPSDYKCEDGDLAAAENIIFNGGCDIRIPQQPSQVKSFGSYEPLYIHKPNNTRTHYICKKTENNVTTIYYVTHNGSTYTSIGNIGTETINNITSIGLVLIVTTSSSIRYYSWKENLTQTAGYENIDVNNIQLKMRFGFNRDDVENPSGAEEGSGRKKFLISDAFPQSGTTTGLDSIQITRIRAAIKSCIEYYQNNNLFYAPFLIRYAVRLYDGNIAYLSAPSLMLPYTGSPAFVYRSGSLTSAYAEAFGVLLQDDFLSTNIETYKDIIKDVVIAITPFIENVKLTADGQYSINSALVKRGQESNGQLVNTTPYCLDFFSISKNKLHGEQTPQLKYFKYNPVMNLGVDYYTDFAQIENLTSTEIYDKIISSSNFYIIKSYTVDEVLSRVENTSGTLTNVTFDGYPLKTLTAQRTIDDNTYCLNKFSNPSVSFQYNGRLNICDYSQSLFNGYIPMLSNTYCEKGWFNGDFVLFTSNYRYKTKVSVVLNGISYNVCNGSPGTDCDVKLRLMSYYYPESNAKEVTFYRKNETSYTKKTVSLESARILNGSMFIDSNLTFRHSMSDESEWEPSYESEWNGIADSDIQIRYQNRIIASYVDNPFIFSIENAALVSSDRIIAAATSAKELSQGQFGQYPIYLFTNDGVWATDISDDGTIVKIVPVSKDVISGDGNSVMTIESSVLFASDKGIMEISGSQTRCLSNVLDNDNNMVIENSPHIMAAISNIKGAPYNVALSFREYISNCRMFSDYINNRIIIYNPAYGYCFAYDILNKVFSIVNQKFHHNINAYPNSHVVVKDFSNNTFKVVDVKDMTPIVINASMNEANGWFLTRPISLGDPNMPKIIDYALQNGVFRNYRRMTNEEISSIHTSFELYAWKLNDDVIYTKNATPSIGDYVYDRHDNRINNMIVDSYLEGTPPMIDVSIDSQIITVSYDRYTSGDMVFDMPDTAQYARDNNAFVSDSIQQVLFGSNDLVNWVVISSSRSHRISDYSGSPYKWFRLAVKCSFKPGESLSSVTFSFRNKFANDKLL